MVPHVTSPVFVTLILSGGADSDSGVGVGVEVAVDVGEGVEVGVGVGVGTNGPAGAELRQPPAVAAFIARTATIYVKLFVISLIVMLFEA